MNFVINMLQFGLICALTFACKQPAPLSPSSGVLEAPGGGGPLFHATRYEETFSFSCNGITAKPADDFLVALSEDSPLLKSKGLGISCPDSWQPIDFNAPRWGADHWLATMTKEKMISDVFSKFPQTFQLIKGVWHLNEPACTLALKNSNICGMTVMVKAHSYVNAGYSSPGANLELKAVVYDICPQNHWNNAIKDLPIHPHYLGGKGNPCRKGDATIDIHGTLWHALGFPTHVDSGYAQARLL
jgi:hypothetical protein